jgi:hypothetical protein
MRFNSVVTKRIENPPMDGKTKVLKKMIDLPVGRSETDANVSVCLCSNKQHFVENNLVINICIF